MPSIKHHDGSNWSSAIAGGKIKHRNSSGAWDPALIVRRRNTNNTAWIEAYAGSDKRTYAVPTSYSRSFRSTSGGSAGTWITGGFTDGAFSVRQGKYGGEGAYLIKSTFDIGSGVTEYVSACYPDTYEWVGVLEFSDSDYVYDITDGWANKVKLEGVSTPHTLADLIAVRPTITNPKLYIQRRNETDAQEGYGTAFGNVYVGEYNGSISETTASLSNLSASNQITTNPGGNWLSRGEKVTINLTSTIINNIKSANKHIAIYGNSTLNTNNQGLRDPDNPGGGSCGPVPDFIEPFTAASSQGNYVFWYPHGWNSGDIADPSVAANKSGPFITLELDY